MHKKNICILCENNYAFLNNDNSLCILEDNLKNKEYCSDDNGKNYYTCKENIIHCEEGKMKKCNKCQKSYTILNSNKKECIEIKSLNPKKKIIIQLI